MGRGKDEGGMMKDERKLICVVKGDGWQVVSCVGSQSAGQKWITIILWLLK
jgi:hypothetical protein